MEPEDRSAVRGREATREKEFQRSPAPSPPGREERREWMSDQGKGNAKL